MVIAAGLAASLVLAAVGAVAQVPPAPGAAPGGTDA